MNRNGSWLKLSPILLLPLATAINVALPATPANAQEEIRFHDIAADDGAGIDYRRTRSPRHTILEEIMEQPLFVIPEDLARTPLKSRGTPGVAIFDYDRDGDLDLYVTNGPGTPNSLYANQLVESGSVRFEDRAAAAGVAATAQDSSGVCYGDIDNDGDHDLVVLGMGEPNLLFENQADGTFIDVARASGIDDGLNEHATSCALGDVDGDGRLDLVVANFATLDDQLVIYVEPFALNEHNRLYHNEGGNVFTDVSEASGIRRLAGFPAAAAGAAGASWAVALVDYDLDGDVDLFTADDQGAIFSTERGGVDRGLIHLHQNDGSGRFTDVAVEAGTAAFGTWMGLTFADFNGDGRLDFYASNLGDYAPVFTGFGLGEFDIKTSRWFLGQVDGTFSDPGIGELVATSFGWGTSALDYDNDGDSDVIVHGGLDFGNFIDATNPGVPLRNDGAARFTYDLEAMSESTDHTFRTVHGVAVGDLDQNGFVDIVSVSNFDLPHDIPQTFTPIEYGIPFDRVVFTVDTFVPVGEVDPVFGIHLNFVPNPDLPPLPEGTLAVELNRGGNGHSSAELHLLGGAGLIAEGRVNRDAIGAVVSFTPLRGQRQMQPILGGSSYASQDSLAAHFGLGGAPRGSAEVLWPGGVRNRLYGVRAGESIVFPEIPCDFSDPAVTPRRYVACVGGALAELRAAGELDTASARRFARSALRAFVEERARRP